MIEAEEKANDCVVEKNKGAKASRSKKMSSAKKETRRSTTFPMQSEGNLLF